MGNFHTALIQAFSTCQLWQVSSYTPCRRSSIANGLSVLLGVVKLVTICRCILHIMHCSRHRTSPAQHISIQLKQIEITHYTVSPKHIISSSMWHHSSLCLSSIHRYKAKMITSQVNNRNCLPHFVNIMSIYKTDEQFCTLTVNLCF